MRMWQVLVIQDRLHAVNKKIMRRNIIEVVPHWVVLLYCSCRDRALTPRVIGFQGKSGEKCHSMPRQASGDGRQQINAMQHQKNLLIEPPR